MTIFANKPVFTLDQVADQLTTEGWSYYGDTPRRFDVVTGGSLTVNISDLNGAGKKFARAALDAWSSATGLEFKFRQGHADIYFSDDGKDTAYADSYVSYDGFIYYSEVNISQDWIAQDWFWENGSRKVDYASYSMQTYIHEIGHALGLAHAGNYDASDVDASGSDFATEALFQNDSWQTTVMSYFSNLENTYLDADFAYVLTPMPADLVAIHSLYGTPVSANSGDTVYGYDQNLGGYWDTLDYSSDFISMTIFDTDGMDTLDLSKSLWDQYIDLTPGAISDAGGLTGNVIIAQDTIIESAVGGYGHDIITGNSADNVITGGQGNDALFGGEGADILIDALGSNLLDGEGGDDVIAATAGGNTILGGQGADILIGGRARDDMSGGQGDDILIGDGKAIYFGAADRLEGGEGNDLLMGGKGADVFVFSPNSGIDVIVSVATEGLDLQTSEFIYVGADFEIGRDIVELDGYRGLSAAVINANITQTDDGAMFTYQGSQILFWDISASELTADSFIF